MKKHRKVKSRAKEDLQEGSEQLGMQMTGQDFSLKYVKMKKSKDPLYRQREQSGWTQIQWLNQLPAKCPASAGLDQIKHHSEKCAH